MYSINNIKLVLKYLLKSYHMESFILCTCMHDIFSLVDISLMFKAIIKNIPLLGVGLSLLVISTLRKTTLRLDFIP